MQITQGFVHFWLTEVTPHNNSWYQPSSHTVALIETWELMSIQYMWGLHLKKAAPTSNVQNVKNAPFLSVWSGVSPLQQRSWIQLTDSQSVSAQWAKVVTSPRLEVCKSAAASVPVGTNQRVPTSSRSANRGPPRRERSDGLYMERAQFIQHHFTEERIQERQIRETHFTRRGSHQLRQRQGP